MRPVKMGTIYFQLLPLSYKLKENDDRGYTTAIVVLYKMTHAFIII